MKKFLTFLLSFCILFNLFITPAVAETSSSASTEKQYYKFIADDTGNIYPILISEQEFQKAVGIRSPHYAEGWIVTSISGNTVAYISLHYQTVTSAGKQVFDLSTAYLEVNPQNGYAGHIDFLNKSAHSIIIQYTYSNILENGYRTHTFYPQH